LRCEQAARRRWPGDLPDVRLNEITRAHLNGFIAKCQADGLAPRTVNLYMIARHNVLKRSPVTPEQLEKLLSVAASVPLNGQLLANVLRLMACCGSQVAETLRPRWADVDFGRRQISIGSDGLAKNRKSRVVDFNDVLERHLREMFARRPRDSEFLFPSPRRGEADVPVVNFNKALRSACQTAGLPQFGFHDCRHYFISNCVLSGIDYMTIARWVGHQDGGVLIVKVFPV
jgi:integrase